MPNIDFSTRDTLPKDDFGKILIPLDLSDTAEPADMGPLLNSGFAMAEDLDNDYNNLLKILRNDYYTLCQWFIDPGHLEHGHYGDDCGDYRTAAADMMGYMNDGWGSGMWHSELYEDQIKELNSWINCADEDHCIHQLAIDGPDLWLDRVAVDWESCPLKKD